MPTIDEHLRAHVILTTICAREICGNEARVDLDALAARGLADRDVSSLRFACSKCGGKRGRWLAERRPVSALS